LIGALRNPLRLLALVVVGALLFIALRNILPQGTQPAAYRPDQFIRHLIFGLAQGGIYALLALGYTLIYSLLSVIHFAHGEVFMAGAYGGFFALSATAQSGLLNDNPLLALALACGCAVLAAIVVVLLLERITFRPLRNAPRFALLVVAIGSSIVAQQLFFHLFGGGTRRYPDVHLLFNGIDIIGGRYDVNLFGIELRLLPVHFVVFVTALVLMLLFWLVLTRTKMGRAMRAVAEDKSYAALMGIPVDRMIVRAFLLVSVLAGVGGVLYALYSPQITPFVGFLPGIKALTAAMLGGIGSIPGAILGGILLGLTESIAPSMLGLPAQLGDAIVFAVLILILTFRPEGLLGDARAKTRV
jgi:branched-chain amino acid transport system permease protein